MKKLSLHITTRFVITLAVLIAMATSAFAQCTNYTITVTSGSFPSEISWTLTNTGGTVVASGNAPATVNICLNNGTYTVNMYDSFGDGWNGATWIIACSGGAVLASGTLGFWWSGSQAVTLNGSACSPCPVGQTQYTVSVSTGSFPSEVSWSLVSSGGITLASGGAPATVSICASPGCFTFNMFDSFGDGWNGSAFTITGPGGAVVASGTLGNGSSGWQQVALAGGSCVPACAAGETAIQLVISMGTWPTEVSWTLTSSGTGTTLASGGAPWSGWMCLANGCYVLNMLDSFGDGWNGSTYTLYNGVGAVLYTGTLATGSSGMAVFSIGGADCSGIGPVTASDCPDAVMVCDNLSFAIDPNGYGAIYEIPALGTIANPDLWWGDGVLSAWGSDNWGCLRNQELNSTWMIVNIWGSGWLNFTFGGLGTQSGFYDWSMWYYDVDNTCQDIYNNLQAPERCNWNGVPWGGTGLESPVPAGGDPSNYEPPLWVNAGEQHLICFSNWSSVTNIVPLEFGGTAIVSCENVLLPVELISFSAAQYGNEVHLAWSTQTENNNDYFTIQHSADNVHWTDIGLLDGNGTTQQIHHYTFTDPKPRPGINYYRFIQVDFNGMSRHSDVATVNFKSTNASILPNPNDGIFQLTIEGVDVSRIEIFNSLGEKILFDSDTREESALVSINLKAAQAGVYLIRNAGNNAEPQRFIVQSP